VSGEPVPVVHARTSAFSYQCRACSRCCYGRRIQVNPYELARLARGLGITTTDVIERFTVDNGTALAHRADTACVFLGDTGCTVHADRPLACRLYPLGRVVRADGGEAFIENEPLPDTKGLYGDDGTVASFIESQSVAPYIEAADRYYAVFRQLMSGGDEARADSTTDIDPRAFIDADLALQMDATAEDDQVPTSVESLIDAHLVLIERWAQQL
jgi:Fe-S-cluster containining protein